MPNDTITLTSTTDSPEEVQAALTGIPIPPVEEKPVAPAAIEPAPGVPPMVDPEKPAAEAKPPENETPEQKTTREETTRLSAREKRVAKINTEIDSLTTKKYDARRDADAEEARLADLRRQRTALEAELAGKKPAAPSLAAGVTRPSGQPVETAAPLRPEPKMDDVDATTGQAKYPEYDDWVKDLNRWNRDEAIREADARSATRLDEERQAASARIERDVATRAEQEALATHSKRIEAFRTSHADYDATLSDAKDVVDDLVDQLGPHAMSVIDTFTVRDAENGAELMYQLAQHPDDLRRIAALPLPQQLIALGRFERAHQEAASPAPGPSSVVPQKTKAPSPISPVRGSATAPVVSPENETHREYMARRNREEAALAAGR